MSGGDVGDFVSICTSERMVDTVYIIIYLYLEEDKSQG